MERDEATDEQWASYKRQMSRMTRQPRGSAGHAAGGSGGSYPRESSRDRDWQAAHDYAMARNDRLPEVPPPSGPPPWSGLEERRRLEERERERERRSRDRRLREQEEDRRMKDAAAYFSKRDRRKVDAGAAEPRTCGQSAAAKRAAHQPDIPLGPSNRTNAYGQRMGGRGSRMRCERYKQQYLAQQPAARDDGDAGHPTIPSGSVEEQEAHMMGGPQLATVEEVGWRFMRHAMGS